jgi:hypothetical protein
MSSPTDAAEIVSVFVPEIMDPTVTDVPVTVTVRNTGTSTWRQDLGYMLGSQNPIDNNTWGANRIPMKTNYVARPGEIHTFEWLVRVPQVQGVYDFQWRMILLGQHWFGPLTPNRLIHVQPRTTGGSWLVRDTKSGLLFRPPTPAITTLRGGHYHLFERASKGDNAVVYVSSDPNLNNHPIKLNYGAGHPCAPNTQMPPAQGGDPPPPAAKMKLWAGEASQWSDLFTALQGQDINLLRIFLMNGFGLEVSGTTEVTKEVYPFKTVEVSETDPETPLTKQRKWKIKEAITEPVDTLPAQSNWNVNYFNRLRAFAQKAQQFGVYLQLSLFNYYELDDDTWDISIWNPARSADAAWGRANLVNVAGQGQRQLTFITAAAGSGLRGVQERMVRKVVKELRGLPNIILEVMNEPHQGTQQQSAQFASTVVGWILDEGKAKNNLPAWRPLISVNASRRPFDPAQPCAVKPDTFDVDWWAANSDPRKPGFIKNYEEVDIISYHGLTGYGLDCIDITCKCLAAGCKQRTYSQVKFPPVDLDSIKKRFCDFFGQGRTKDITCPSTGKHPNKALMMSTDAVSVDRYQHVYGRPELNVNMNLRDGQIITGLVNAGGTASDNRTRSDLENWAYWCFFVSMHSSGVIHFQNHSTFEETYTVINKAFRDALTAT